MASTKTKDIQQDMGRKLSKWLADDSYLQDYDQYVFYGAEALIRIFRYESVVGPGSELYVDMTSRSKASSAYNRNIAIARVIGIGPDVTKVLPGDVIAIPDHMASASINPAYEDYMEAMKSKPQPKSAAPAMYIDNLIQWSKYLFKANKLSPLQKEDFLTFLIPESYIRAKIKTDEAVRVSDN